MRGSVLVNFHFFCSQCGSKKDRNVVLDSTANEEEIITYYFQKNYSYDAVIMFLAIYHNIVISKRTFKRRLHQYGLKKRKSNISDASLRRIIEEELKGPAALKGYRGMWNALKCSYGINVKRDTVMTLLQELDPEGIELRKSRRLTRRIYRSQGSNSCWHVDGYDKLKPFGLPIVTGAIDGQP